MHQTGQRPQNDHSKEPQNDENHQHAIFLSGHSNDEIRMRIGQGPFHGAFTGAHTKQAALLNGIGRISKLGIRVHVCRHIAVNAPREMLAVIIGDEAGQNCCGGHG